jgi:hypothetical protein
MCIRDSAWADIVNYLNQNEKESKGLILLIEANLIYMKSS